MGPSLQCITLCGPTVLGNNPLTIDAYEAAKKHRVIQYATISLHSGVESATEDLCHVLPELRKGASQ